MISVHCLVPWITHEPLHTVLVMNFEMHIPELHLGKYFSIYEVWPGHLHLLKALYVVLMCGQNGDALLWRERCQKLNDCFYEMSVENLANLGPRKQLQPKTRKGTCCPFLWQNTVVVEYENTAETLPRFSVGHLRNSIPSRCHQRQSPVSPPQMSVVGDPLKMTEKDIQWPSCPHSGCLKP